MVVVGDGKGIMVKQHLDRRPSQLRADEVSKLEAEWGQNSKSLGYVMYK